MPGINWMCVELRLQNWQAEAALVVGTGDSRVQHELA